MVRTSPPRSSAGLRHGVVAAAALGLLLAACTASGGTSAPSPAALASPAASPTITPTLPPAATPSPVPSTLASPDVSPSPAEVPSQPPKASLAVEGGDPVAGMLGSYTWAGGGSDSPWLPGTPMRAGSGERLTLTLAPLTGIQTWTARRVKAGATDGSSAVALGSGDGGSVSFDAPPAGHWSVQVTVRFADDLGSATYYWRLAVS